MTNPVSAAKGFLRTTPVQEIRSNMPMVCRGVTYHPTLDRKTGKTVFETEQERVARFRLGIGTPTAPTKADA